jgi:g-D-glutamyl-meso-diaminopimelate peptidase
MRPLFSKKVVATGAIIVALSFGVIAFIVLRSDDVPETTLLEPVSAHRVIGSSVEGREIEVYTYGNGDTHLAFIGGMHGGYEWNSTLLAYKLIDYLNASPENIPENITVTVIPSANPDGLYKVIGKEGRFNIKDVPENEDSSPGRFNANMVDLNRNFDCKWKPESMWRGNVVSAGTEAFSEPEAKAIRNFVLENNPDAVIFFHSQANAVYASECEDGILPKTREIMNAYSLASGYQAVESFDQYEITGDAEGWLASIGIPAITVELKTHENIEWERNLAGIKSILELYSEFE